MSARGKELLRNGVISPDCVMACADEGETMPGTGRSRNCFIGCIRRVAEKWKEERESFFYVGGRYVSLEDLEEAPTTTPTGGLRNNERIPTCRGGMGRSVEVDRGGDRGGVGLDDWMGDTETGGLFF